MKKILKFATKALILTILFLVIMLFKEDYRQGGGWLFSSPSLHTRGWPVPYVVWDISDWPKGFQGTLTLEQLAHENNVFLAGRSLVGLALSFVFWYLVSSTIFILKAVASRVKENYVKNPQRWVKNLFRALTIISITFTLLILYLKIPSSVECGICIPTVYRLGFTVPIILHSLFTPPMGCAGIAGPHECIPAWYVIPIETTITTILFGYLWLTKRKNPRS